MSRTHHHGFSAAGCRGLIEALPPIHVSESIRLFSAAGCRGLIEATALGMDR